MWFAPRGPCSPSPASLPISVQKWLWGLDKGQRWTVTPHPRASSVRYHPGGHSLSVFYPPTRHTVGHVHVPTTRKGGPGQIVPVKNCDVCTIDPTHKRTSQLTKLSRFLGQRRETSFLTEIERARIGAFSCLGFPNPRSHRHHGKGQMMPARTTGCITGEKPQAEGR